jgi:hypothetical protein
MWQMRNDARESKNLLDPKAVALKTIAGTEEWQNLHAITPVTSTKQKEHWLPPEMNWCKANADGSYNLADGTGGADVVPKDHHGGFITGAGHFFPSFRCRGCKAAGLQKGFVLSSRG